MQRGLHSGGWDKVFSGFYHHHHHPYEEKYNQAFQGCRGNAYRQPVRSRTQVPQKKSRKGITGVAEPAGVFPDRGKGGI